jgi:hypothetical protein
MFRYHGYQKREGYHDQKAFLAEKIMGKETHLDSKPCMSEQNQTIFLEAASQRFALPIL